MTHGTESGIDQNLRHGVLGRGIELHLVGLVHPLNKIYRVVIGDELQRIGDAVNQILLTNHGHYQFCSCWSDVALGR